MHDSVPSRCRVPCGSPHLEVIGEHWLVVVLVGYVDTSSRVPLTGSHIPEAHACTIKRFKKSDGGADPIFTDVEMLGYLTTYLETVIEKEQYT
jgi:hypothetical protein